VNEGMNGAELIAAERERQITQEEWSFPHDDGHVYGELVEAAAVYVRTALTSINPNSPIAAAPMSEPPSDWPWEEEDFKPAWSDPVRNLVKAGALIAAEIDRLQRAAKP
jgi:hypothetical protein